MLHICAIINSTKGGYRVKNISSGIADMLWTQGIIQEDDIDKCKCTFGKYSARARERKILRVHK